MIELLLILNFLKMIDFKLNLELINLKLLIRMISNLNQSKIPLHFSILLVICNHAFIIFI